MNATERQMLDLLKRGRDDHGVVAVKAEFEAEGTRPDEFLRLIEIAARADLKVALKIGGCEAISDLLASHNYGIDYVIAPMVETPYALSKFIDAKNKTHPGGNGRTSFLFNLETQTTLEHLDQMGTLARGEPGALDVGGVVGHAAPKRVLPGRASAPSATSPAPSCGATCASAPRRISSSPGCRRC